MCFELLLLFFFFFQAEDGIRDYKVTGVQTCALPISALRHLGDDAHGRRRGFDGGVPRAGADVGGGLRARRHQPSRSEERRVGKSVDLGGRRIIKKKKKKR